MKKVLFIYGIFFLTSCNNNAVQKPDNLLDEAVMENIIYDASILQAAQSYKHRSSLDETIQPSEYIFKKYNIDSITYIQNYKYYASDIKSFKKMYSHVNEKIQKNKKAIDSIVVGNNEIAKETIISSDTPVIE